MSTCETARRRIADVWVAVCGDCRVVEWHGPDHPLDPAEGMARLFGSFDLVARMPGLRSPGPEVLVYRPPRRSGRAGLEAFPPHVWLEAAPDLWLSHDGERLLLSPTRPLLLGNLIR